MNIENMCYRVIMAVDMEKSTTRTNPAKAHLRRAMYDSVNHALHAGGITDHHRDPFIDRGDGVLVLLHPTEHVPKTRLLDTIMPTLATRLVDCHGQCPRLRAVVHAGEIHYDRQGCFGEALDTAFRLLDAPRVKAELRHSPSPLTLVVSEDIYRAVVRHDYPNIPEAAYRGTVRVRVRGQTHRGWTHQPAGRSS
ncbi:hypothetical protein [Amycolatopsis sp. BJA-103]|uniref:hypothetical protein n=1 Tax=Amycolatopsis sp. BJA-103 TaxID=1911175 RepID=UPI000C78E594|nr:hypothetical protein [Amycolatopsis sp. BJA-103]PNE13247.1 hypothetical protein B1H26_41380 [Amycolatopsis sp. BJA-103]